jgi:hypothetical protein
VWCAVVVLKPQALVLHQGLCSKLVRQQCILWPTNHVYKGGACLIKCIAKPSHHTLIVRSVHTLLICTGCMLQCITCMHLKGALTGGAGCMGHHAPMQWLCLRAGFYTKWTQADVVLHPGYLACCTAAA